MPVPCPPYQMPLLWPAPAGSGQASEQDREADLSGTGTFTEARLAVAARQFDDHVHSGRAAIL